MRSLRHLCPCAGVLIVLLTGAVPAASASGLNLAQPLSTGHTAGRAGLAAAAPSPTSVASQLAESTGLSPAQVSSSDVCPAPRPGMAQCAAQKVVLRSSGRAVHPRLAAGPTLTQAFPRHRAGSGVTRAAGTTSAPASPPQSGTPAYLEQAYDLTYLSQTAGGNDTVAIVDAYDDPNAESDLATYRSAYGLPTCSTANGCFRKLNQSGTSSPLPVGNLGWESEISLDLDAVSALCPNCHILLVEANSNYTSDLDAAVSTAQSLGANQISNSWAGGSGAPYGQGSWPGVAVIAATGDNGYLGANVNAYPAAFPGVTAAGGTTVSPATDGATARGFNESAWGGAGSGCDTYEAKPSYQADTGCTGRSWADVSADANPNTGLRIYDANNGGWLLYGGTSLATPLIAAYEGLTGVDGTSPQWAYGDSGLLNDPLSGTNGSCASSILYICNAGVGYDGPTGAGSISGAVVPGGPGIGGPTVGSGANNTYTQSVNKTTASLVGGVYPNDNDTSYYWQYGLTNAYGQQTSAVDVGAGSAPVGVSGTLSGLSSGTLYHYRLVAQNSVGTTYGYDYTLTTWPANAAPPSNSIAPTIGGTTRQGQSLTVNPGGWSPSGNVTYQWQRSTDSGMTWANISGATGSTYTPVPADIGGLLDVVVTETNTYGSGQATSAPVGPVLSGAPSNTAAPTVTGTAARGQTLAASTGTWSPAGSSYATQWERSSNGGQTWVAISGASGATYTLAKADEGVVVEAVVTATNVYGHTSAASAATATVAASPPANTVAPALSGNAQRGSMLTVTPGSWAGVGNSITVQWQRDTGSGFTNIAGATGNTYTLAVADEGASVRANVTASNVDGSASLATSATEPVAPNPPANTVAPTVTGTAQRTFTLTATTGTWTPTGNALTYQWQRDDGTGFADIAGANHSTYSLGTADEGSSLRVVVTATNPDGAVGVPSVATASVAAAPPVNSAVPTLGGTARLGATLTAGTGTWTPAGSTFAFVWQRSSSGGWQTISGATSNTYTLTAAEVGTVVRAVVTASNVDGNQSANSAQTATVLQPPQNTVTPAAPTGTLMDTYVLTASLGSWDTPGSTFSYTWLRCPSGATSASTSCTGVGGHSGTYTLSAADVGHPMGVQVTATSPGGSTSVYSTVTAAVQGRPLTNSATPAITGTPQIPQTLTATPGTWSVPLTSIAYTWLRCDADGSSNCASVSTGSRYTLTTADHGHMLMLSAAAASPGRTLTVTSAPVTVQDQPLPAPAGLPTITGTAERTQTLHGGWTTWSAAPTLTLQWARCDASGQSCAAIPGATGTSYVVTKADEGSTIVFQVTGTNTSGAVISTSHPTALVTSDPPTSTHIPAVTGTAQQGNTLQITGATWTATPDTTFSFQWQRCDASGANCVDISRATNSTYVPVAADVGARLLAEVIAVNADTTTRAYSSATAVVLPAKPRWATLPRLSSDLGHIGDVLTVTPGTWSGPAITTDATQVMRCTNVCTAVGAANAGSYTISSADVGAILRVRETAANSGGSTVVWSATYVGFVRSANSGSAVLAAGRAVLRNLAGRALATVTIGSLAAADEGVVHTSMRTAARVLVIKRAGSTKGILRAWVCPVTGVRGGAPPKCTRVVSVRGRGRITVPATMRGRLRVVVVVRRH